MRVFGKEKDYYDSVQGYGRDPRVVYERRPEFYQMASWPFPKFYGGMHLGGLSITPHIIGFCGKVYPCLSMVNCTAAVSQSKFCYNMKEVDEFLESAVGEANIEVYHGSTTAQRRLPGNSRWYGGKWYLRRKDVCEFMEGITQSYMEMFLSARRPVFAATFRRYHNQWKGWIEWDAILRYYDFVRVFGPYAAFQEVEMFMANLASPEKVIPEISNEDRIESHGFDLKESFRRPKEQ